MTDIEQAKICEAAEFVFKGSEPHLAQFYRNAKIGFLIRWLRSLHN